MESLIDFRLLVDESVVEYRDNVIGFSQVEGVDHDVMLTLGFAQLERVNLDEDVRSSSS